MRHDPSRIVCDQPNCNSWIGDGIVSSSIPKSEYRALGEEIAEISGWRRAGTGWFCPNCVKRGKATDHNPDYVGEHLAPGVPRTDRFGRRVQTMAERRDSDGNRDSGGDVKQAPSEG